MKDRKRNPILVSEHNQQCDATLQCQKTEIDLEINKLVIIIIIMFRKYSHRFKMIHYLVMDDDDNNDNHRPP